MKDLQISGGDLILTGGDLGTVTGAAYIRQRIATALAEPYGSDPFQATWGSVLDSWLGSPITGGTDALVASEVSRVMAQLIAAQQQMITTWALTGTKAQLAAADTIATVDAITATADADPEAIDVLIQLTTQGGQQLAVGRTVTASV
jgi:phage baseplate assembly protein W